MFLSRNTLLESLDIVRTKCDMSPLKRVDGLSSAIADTQIDWGQVEFCCPVRQKRNGCIIALILNLAMACGGSGKTLTRRILSISEYC